MCVYECMSQGSDHRKRCGGWGVSEMAWWLKALTAKSDSCILCGGIRTEVHVLAHLCMCLHTYTHAHTLTHVLTHVHTHTHSV